MENIIPYLNGKTVTVQYSGCFDGECTSLSVVPTKENYFKGEQEIRDKKPITIIPGIYGGKIIVYQENGTPKVYLQNPNNDGVDLTGQEAVDSLMGQGNLEKLV